MTERAGRVPLPAPILETRVIAIARALDAVRLAPVVEALARGGVRALEVTLDSPGALATIAELARRADDHGLAIGAGTVLDPGAAAEAIDAGAAFVVSPHLDAAVVAIAVERGIPAMPGALTPTEVFAAWRAGASAVKVFPASAVGPAFVRELRGPLAGIPLVPTGGVTVETAPAFIAAGAVAVGLGSWLTAGGDADVLADRARQLVAAVAPAGG